MKKFTFTKIRKYLFTRNIKRLKDEFGWDYNSSYDLYRKIKTKFNLEFSSLVLYTCLKFNISANQVSLFGVIWIFFGTFIFFLNKPELIYFGIFIFFTKSISDYVDGALAYLKKEGSREGYEIDLWSGDAGKIGLMIGFHFYIFNIYQDHNYLIICLILVAINLIDPRLHLSKFKFDNTVFDKKLLAHTQKKREKEVLIFKFLKNINFSARSFYIDFLIFLIILDIIYKKNSFLIILPWIWLILSILAFLRTIYKVFYKR